MSRLKIVYFLSLLILVVLIGFTVFRPMAVGGGYSEVSRAHLLQTENEYIVEFDIINHEGEDKNYTITVLIDGKLYTESVLVRDGGMFTYIHHIYPDSITEGDVRFAIYRDGEATPIEKVTYYLK